MKIRIGFVSNSSSSSYVVIGAEQAQIPRLHTAYLHNNVLMIPQTFGGQTDFTECQTFCTFPDRLNFAALVAWYKEGPGGFDTSNTNWTTMLEELLAEEIDHVESIKINFRWDEDATCFSYQDPMCVYDCNYLPHQSWPGDNDNIKAIFKDRETLRQFLFASDSNIRVEYS